MDNITTARERVEKELEDLSEKIKKLQDFINDNPLYSKLSETQQALLACQLDFMKGYARVLDLRLTLWS